MNQKERALAAATKAVAQRAARKGAADDDFRAALIRARDAGATYVEIGLAIGMTHAGVMKIIREKT